MNKLLHYGMRDANTAAVVFGWMSTLPLLGTLQAVLIRLLRKIRRHTSTSLESEFDTQSRSVIFTNENDVITHRART